MLVVLLAPFRRRHPSLCPPSRPTHPPAWLHVYSPISPSVSNSKELNRPKSVVFTGGHCARRSTHGHHIPLPHLQGSPFVINLSSLSLLIDLMLAFMLKTKSQSFTCFSLVWDFNHSAISMANIIHRNNVFCFVFIFFCRHLVSPCWILWKPWNDFSYFSDKPSHLQSFKID